jgi:dCTP diphosphatase
MESKKVSLLELQRIQSEFSEVRGWGKFHSVKNLSMALAGEAGELLELTQWLTEESSNTPDADLRRCLEEEMSDILLYLVRLAERLDIDLLESAVRKIKVNEVKYPIESCYGKSLKYTKLD